MRPVNEPTQIIPFVHAADQHSVTHAEGNAFRQVDVVRYQQRAAIADIDNESLMSRTVIIVGQQAPHEALDFDPAAVIAFLIRLTHQMPLFFFLGRPVQRATKNAANHRWLPRFRFLGALLPRGNRHHRDLNTAIRLATCDRAIVCDRTGFTHA